MYIYIANRRRWIKCFASQMKIVCGIFFLFSRFISHCLSLLNPQSIFHSMASCTLETSNGTPVFCEFCSHFIVFRKILNTWENVEHVEITIQYRSQRDKEHSYAYTQLDWMEQQVVCSLMCKNQKIMNWWGDTSWEHALSTRRRKKNRFFCHILLYTVFGCFIAIQCEDSHFIHFSRLSQRNKNIGYNFIEQYLLFPLTCEPYDFN